MALEAIQICYHHQEIITRPKEEKLCEWSPLSQLLSDVNRFPVLTSVVVDLDLASFDKELAEYSSTIAVHATVFEAISYPLIIRTPRVNVVVEGHDNSRCTGRSIYL